MNQIGYNKNWYAMTDKAIVKTICENIKQMRLAKNISQEQLSKKSGISRITIARLEAGKAINLITLIQLLRALDELELINSFDKQPEISPILLMEAQQKYYRQKASPKQRKNK
jgi:transcriptional regulator with XRE-family HTH domain